MDLINLDLKDKRILVELDMNARMPLSIIAKKVKLSKEVVNYRLKRLEQNKIVTGYYCALDVTKLGYLYCRIFLKFSNTNPKKQEEVVEFGRTTPPISWITLCHGKWDLVFVALCKSMKELESFYDRLIYKFGTYFSKRTISIAYSIHHFKHNYLYNTEDFSQEILGGEASPDIIDDTDKKIISYLSQNCRLPITELAKKINLSPNAVKTRIKRLVKNKVILAFRSKLNTNLLGFEHYKVFLQLQNISQEKMNNLISFLRYNTNVIYITKAIGLSDIEFEIILKGENKLYEFFRYLREKFSDIIMDYDSVLYYEEPLVNYSPFGGL